MGFGLDFSKATAGKSWSEIQTIAANTQAGTGTLGAAYTALGAADKKVFDLSLTKSKAGSAGTVSTVTNAAAVVPAKAATTAATVSTASSVSTAEATAIKAALKTQATSK